MSINTETNKAAWTGIRNANGEDGLYITQADATLLNATIRIQGYDNGGSSYRAASVNSNGYLNIRV